MSAEIHNDSAIGGVPFGIGEKKVGLTQGGEGRVVKRPKYGSLHTLDVSTHILGVKCG